MHQTNSKILLFICTANRCRSPLAAALLQRRIGSEVSYAIISAGTWAKPNMPIHPLTQAAVTQIWGLDLGAHRSQSIDSLPLSNIDLILAMAQGHKEAIQIEFPSVTDRVYLLSEMVGLNFDIADPVQGDLDVHLATSRQIDALLEKGLTKITQLLSQH